MAAADAVEFVSTAAQEAWRATLGLRNRNPGNIDWIVNPLQRWRGMIARNGRFGVFDTDANGVRAIGKELERAASRGARTVDHLIGGIPQKDGSRYDAWAPPQENDTAAYVRNVAKWVGVGANDAIDIHGLLPELTAAIIRQENGAQPYALDDIARWVYS